MPGHVHMLISIHPKYAVSAVVCFIKGKSAIHLAGTFMGRRKNFVRQSFWARGYFVSTIGLDEALVREYIKKQEQEDRRLDQLQLVKRLPALAGSLFNRFERFTAFHAPGFAGGN
jgi:putative transposase